MGSNRVWKLIAGAALVLAALPPSQAAAPTPEAAASQEVQVQGALDPEWGSYRRAYGAAAFFERFTRTRPLIQAQMQVRPVAPDASLSGLHLSIVGVKFVYPRGDAAAAVEFRGADGSTRALLPADLTPFEDGTMGLYSVVVYRFADLPAKGQLIPRTPPMAIGTLYE